MAESRYVEEERRRAHASLTATRGGVAALSERLDQIRGDGRYTEEHKRELLSTAIGEAGASIREALEDAQGALRRALDRADRGLAELREIPPEALSARREALRPFLDRSFEDRRVLLNLYGSNCGDLAARRVLEDHAELLMASGGDVAGPLAEDWRTLQEELFAEQLSPEERQAVEDQAALGEIKGYLDAGVELVGIDLEGLARNGELSAEHMMRRPWLEATLNTYESTYGLPSSDPAAAGRQEEEVIG